MLVFFKMYFEGLILHSSVADPNKKDRIRIRRCTYLLGKDKVLAKSGPKAL